MDFSGSVVVVTGGSGGLGAALCRFMALRGARVAVFYHGNSEAAENVASVVRSEGGNAQPIRVDVTLRESVEAAMEYVVSHFGTLDFLINCAGISRSGVSWKMQDEDWASILETNLTGAFNCTRAVLPHMREKGKGRIVNISSIVGQIGVPGTTAYAASKAGILGLTRATAAEVANRGITVNALALGYFDAGIIAQVPQEKLKKIVDNIPVGRLGLPEEFCHTVGFLCTEGAAYITGQTINVNGGLYLG